MTSYEQYTDQLLNQVFQNAKSHSPESLGFHIDWPDDHSADNRCIQHLSEDTHSTKQLSDDTHSIKHLPADNHSIQHVEPIQRPSLLKDTLSRKFTRHDNKKQFGPFPEKKPEESRKRPPKIQRKPSFWKPREERAKGWWKGEQQKVPSIKKPKRPMAFRTPKRKPVNTSIDPPPLPPQPPVESKTLPDSGTKANEKEDDDYA
ncbi:hypothetical protein G6F56_012115 [Rhizopus delemar]|nr:hypothetical protein G6F56_012115 [Rhizopus delemar]